MQHQYDYIMAGGGLSGLALTLQLIRSSSLRNKKILIIDKDNKTSNDRTWCFWATPDDDVPAIDVKQWKYANVYRKDFHKRLDIAPYTYRMIRGIDFYDYFRNQIASFPNIEWKKEEIISIDKEEGKVITNKGTYVGEYVFKSYFHYSEINVPKNYTYLLQHFKGWFIKTKEDVFDDSEIRMMDFRTPQKGDTRFFYLLPTSPNEALVEYTVFSPSLLEQESYDEALKSYIEENLGLSDYEIVEEEFNAIPMTDYGFAPKVEGKVVNIGTLGGFVKPSSGYCFKRTFEKTAKIATALAKNEPVTANTMNSPYNFRLYDSILLWGIHNKLVAGDWVFAKMFKHLPDNMMLRFLDERTKLTEDIKVMANSHAILAWALANRLRVMPNL